MSCCGKTRTSLSPAATAPAARAPARRAAFHASAGAATADFEYLGGSILTVIGQGTGRQYRFVGHGARVRVDPRDRASLAAVPQLREVTLQR